MMNSTSKKGRPTAFYRPTWGGKIDGLSRLGDGRWKVFGSTVIKFSEADERLAVARFQKIIAERNGKKLGTLAVHADAVSALKDITERTVDAGGALDVDIEKVKGGNGYAVNDETLSPKQWSWLRKQFLTRPGWVATQVGLQQLAWVADLKPPTPSPKLSELIANYAAKPGLTQDEVSRCKRFWLQFEKLTGIKTIGEMNHDIAERYEKAVRELDLAPKSIKHRFSAVRTIIAYNLRRGKGVHDCRQALDVLAMLQVDNTNPLDPHPISPAHFWAIHSEAVKAQDTTFAAMMLFALNAALYPSEAGAVRWDEIDTKRAEFVTRRRKTGVPRIACLWSETIKALAKVERTHRDTVFNTPVRSYNRCSVQRDWTKYRIAAKVPAGVVFSDIRDASFTVSCRKSLDEARLLCGHRLPGAVDNYVLRSPQSVADVCKAIRTVFYAVER